MVSELFINRRCVHALRDRPRSELVEGFARHLVQGGYAVNVARRHIRGAEHLIDWADRRHLPIERVDDAALGQFAQHIRRCKCRDYGPVRPTTVLPGARSFMTHLRRTAVINAPGGRLVVTTPCCWWRSVNGCGTITYSGQWLHNPGDQSGIVAPAL